MALMETSADSIFAEIQPTPKSKTQFQPPHQKLTPQPTQHLNTPSAIIQNLVPPL